MTISSSPSSLWPTNTLDLSKLLNIEAYPAGTTNCHGHHKETTTRCGNRVSKASAARINEIVGDIVGEGRLSELVLRAIEELSRLVHCVAFHRYQASEKQVTWRSILSSFTKAYKAASSGTGSKNDATTSPDGDSKAPRPSKGPKTSDRSTTARKLKTDRAGDHSDTNVTTSASTSNTSAPASNAPPPEDGRGLPAGRATTAASSRPRRVSPRNKDPPPQAAASGATTEEHLFQPFHPRHRGTANEEIRTKLLATQDPDAFTGSADSIYAYTLPEPYRSCTASPVGYVKIGRSGDVAKRMRAWENQCGYPPQPQFQYKMANCKLMERIVHLHLYGVRRQEQCRRCQKKHIEWFEITVDKADRTVRLWRDWMAMRPYRDRGVLSGYWRRRLEALDLSDPRCWEVFVYESSRWTKSQTAAGDVSGDVKGTGRKAGRSEVERHPEPASLPSTGRVRRSRRRTGED